jgi:hypothetical protein
VVGQRPDQIAFLPPQVAAIGKGLVELRIEPDRLVIIGHRPMVVAEVLPDQAAITIGDRVVRIDANGFLESRQGAIDVAGFVSVEWESALLGSSRTASFASAIARSGYQEMCPYAVDGGEFRIEVDRRIVIGEGSLGIALSFPGGAGAVIGQG